MNHFGKLLLLAATAVFLTLSLALAGPKFENKDTAKDRQDEAFGTEQSDDTSGTSIGTNDAGNSAIRAKPRPAPEPVDWYDKVIITVNPNVNWPQDSSSTTTTTTTGFSNATDSSSTTTTTQQNQ